jgi:non-ribosomal peptide synthetase component F
VRNTGSIPQPQPQPRPFALSNHHLVLPPQVLAATRLVCSQQGVTLFSSMLTALKLALAECTGLSEQIVGLAVAGRDRARYDNSVGCFENIVPTRDTVVTTGSPSLLRQQVHAHVQNALLHALPLQQLIAELQPAVLAGGNAWFDVLFTFQTLPPCEMRFDGLATRVESVQPLHGPYRLKVEVLPGVINAGAPWQIRLEYAHERFEQRDITKLAETLQRHIVSMAG